MSVKKTLSSLLFLVLWVAMIVQAIPHSHHVYGENAHIESQQGIYKHFVNFLDLHKHSDEEKSHKHANDHAHYFHSHSSPAFLDCCGDELPAKQLISLDLFFFELDTAPVVAITSNYRYVQVFLEDTPFLLNHSLRGPPVLA